MTVEGAYLVEVVSQEEGRCMGNQRDVKRKICSPCAVVGKEDALYYCSMLSKVRFIKEIKHLFLTFHGKNTDNNFKSFLWLV